MQTQSLQSQFRVWTVLLVVIPSLLIMSIYTVSQIHIAKQQNLELISQQVAFQERLIEYWIEERANDVKKLSQLEAFRNLNEGQMRDTLDLMQRYSKDFDSLSFIDKNGFFRMSTLSKGIQYKSASGKPYYETAVAGKDYISDVVIGRNSGLPIINFSSPIYDSTGSFQGLILGSVRTTTIQTLLRENWTGQTGEILLVTSEGTMIAKPRYASMQSDKRFVDGISELQVKTTADALKNIRFGEAGASSWFDYLDNKVIGASRYLPERGWTLIGKINEAEVLAPIYNQLAMMAGGTIIVVLLLLPLGTLITNQIKRPVEWLIRQSCLVSTKNYGKVGIEKYPDKVPKELGSLCTAFIQMSAEIESTIGTIKESKAQIASQMQELLSVNGALEKEIIERQKVQADLQYLNARLEDEVARRTAELKKSERDFRTLVENNPAVICRFDRRYRFLYANPEHAVVTGRSVDQFIGKTWADIGVSEELYSPWIDQIETAFRTGCAVEYESLGGLQNQDCFYSMRFIPEYDSAGKVDTVLVVSHDVTDQKLAEEALKQSANRLRDILDQCPAGIVVVDKNGSIEAMNESLISVVAGRSRQDCIGHSYFDVIAKMGHDKESSPIHWALQGTPTRNQVMFRGGRDWAVNVTPIHDNGEITGAIGVYQDITETLKVERERVEALQRFEMMFLHNLAAVGVYRVKDWKILDVNPAWEQVYGFTRADVIGRNLDELGLVPPNLSQTAHVDQSHPTSVLAESVDMVVQTKDGLVRKVLFSALRINFGGEPCLLATALDVTDKSRMEKEMAHLDRLNLVGEMAASIGHEVRNPMTTVRGYLQLFQGKEAFANYSSQLSLMIEELDRANAIITEFLSLAKNKAVEMKLGNLNCVIETLYPLLQADALRMGHDVHIEPGCIPEVAFSEKELRQLILNLVRNSFEAMENNGVVSIRTYMDNEQLKFEIRDTGRGIPDEVMDKLGTPFVTTKDGGTGLGLAVCYRIAERHGAKIDVVTGPAGTAFTIIFTPSIIPI